MIKVRISVNIFTYPLELLSGASVAPDNSEQRRPGPWSGQFPQLPSSNEANMQALAEATHARNPALLASKPLRRALSLQAKSPAAPGARTLRCRQTKPSPRRPTPPTSVFEFPNPVHAL